MISVAAFALTEMAQAIKSAYGVVIEINDFVNEHIEALKASKNEMISRVGRVLEGAKYGFGIGYVVPMAIIAVGQLLLGNPLVVAKTILAAGTLTNPIAMTCAAVGAIYYGWAALTDDERQEILERLSRGFEIGIELVKSIIAYVVGKTTEVLTSENVLELKKYIAEGAKKFGRTLADVTGSITDKIKGAFDVVAKTSINAVDKTKDIAGSAYQTASDTAGKVKDAGTKAADSTLAALDLNGDGKVDLEDLKIAMRRKSQNGPIKT
jgi:hypothetical protein